MFTKKTNKTTKKTTAKKPAKLKTISEKKLTELAQLLADAERSISVLNRRGIKFSEFLNDYYKNNQLPMFRIQAKDKSDEFFYDRAKYDKKLEALTAKLSEEDIDNVTGDELHEVGRINEINEKLSNDFGLELTDFLLKALKTISGESVPTKFALTNGDNSYEVASLGEICSAIRQIGGRGIEIKRFKGLGEMNADQLWDTTMNPNTRTLLKVKLEDAGEADRLFSILMGSDVEKRRNFIQEHALEVQNLDV